MRALVYVQHLLGTGHVVRASAIARALLAQGVDVILLLGNTPPPTLDLAGLAIETLPPVRAADASFSRLVTPEGQPIDDDIRHARAERLLTLVETIRPDILLTETFPFGRRAFAQELLPALNAARARARPALVAASVRDILVKKSDPAKTRWMAEVARTHYDCVLVHADPALVRFDASFPHAAEIADLIRYTGFVYAPSSPQPPGDDGRGEVIVSCGGGPVGARLLQAAVTARPHAHRATGTWRVLASASHGDDRLAALAAAATPGTIVEPARPDFSGLIKRAAVSVSQAGYNTVLDVLSAGCPAVLVPFAEGDETEQTQRAEILAARGMAIQLSEGHVTPERLAGAADQACVADRPTLAIDLAGAEKSARLLIAEAKKRDREERT
ncbi:glycosyltransferase family protein [Amorphus sp. 3PC139-8]|uniref:glycosyltransferase family protein n=1 Tax=Amorphus sp. 3PC139-8 TaxID=2735676 RepID=UPI00345DDC23